MRRRAYLAAVTAAVAGLAGCGGDSGDGGASGASGAGTPTPTKTRTPEPTPTSLNLGESYELGDMVVAVDDVEVIGTDHARADEGKQIVHAQVTARNEGSEAQSAPGFGKFYLATADEQWGTNNYTTYHDNTRDLLPGKSGSGYIEYEIPESVAEDDLEQVAYVPSNGQTVSWAIE